MKNYLLILLTFLSLSAFGQADVITFEDKDKTIPAPSVRRLVRDVDLNEIKDVVNQHAELINDFESGGQPVDSDLTAISGLSPSNDDVIQRKSGAWVNRTLAQIKSDLSLNNVDNTSDANKPVSTAQLTALNLKASLASPTFTGTVSGITKTMVGLGNVDNTADASKPVSTAQQTALNLKANLASPTFTGTVSGITKTMVGLGNADNTSDVNKPVSTATQNALNLKTAVGNFARRITPTGTVNGTNPVFVIPQDHVDGSDEIFVNGIQQIEGEDYGIVDETFTFYIAPEVGDDIRVNYIRP